MIDAGDRRLRLVRAVGVGAARIAVLRVPIIGARRRRSGSSIWFAGGTAALPFASVYDVVGETKKHAVGAGAALDRLMVVVAQRVRIGELLEVGHVALLHVVEPHRRWSLRRWSGR